MHRVRSSLALALASAFALAGCEGFVIGWPARERAVVHEPGPPPHAPAHGYRRKHASGCDLRYDASLGVYVVLGQRGLYFHDGSFVRFRDGAWQISMSLGGPWTVGNARWVPPGLREKHHAQSKKSHHAKKRKKHDRHPARGDW